MSAKFGYRVILFIFQLAHDEEQKKLGLKKKTGCGNYHEKQVVEAIIDGVSFETE